MKKILAFILMVGMISNTGIAYGATTEDSVICDSGIVGSEIQDVVENEHQGVTDKAEESLDGIGDTQEVDDKEVVPEGSQEVIAEPKDSESAEDKEQQAQKTEPIAVTAGSGTFDGDTFGVNSYGSFDFMGTFKIDLNAGELKGSPVTLKNEGETSFILTAELCKSVDSNSPMVVRPDHFADWTTISTEETTGKIAFGFLVKNEAGEELVTFWFADEDSQTTEAVYTVAPGETVTVEIIGKHGLSWQKACTLSYDCKVGIEVIPIEVIVEQPIKPEEGLLEESISEGKQIEGGATEDDILKEGQTENDHIEEGETENVKPEEDQPEEQSPIPSLPEVAPPVVNDKEQVEEAPEENNPTVEENNPTVEENNPTVEENNPTVEENIPTVEDKDQSDKTMNEQEYKETETAAPEDNVEQSHKLQDDVVSTDESKQVVHL